MRDRWSPAHARIYSIHPWQMGDYRPHELVQIERDLARIRAAEPHGLH